MKLPTNFQTTIVTDFNTFLSYCEAIKPPISKGKEFITRKAVFEINEKLQNPHEGLTVKNDQNHYAQVHLFYHLGLNSDLFFLDWSKKSKPCFAPNTVQIERFKALNKTEQYVFLFQTFYAYSNFGMINQEDIRYFDEKAFEVALSSLAELEADKNYDVSRHNIEGRTLDFELIGISSYPSLLLYGQYFGLWNVTEFDGKNHDRNKTYFRLKGIATTEFGKKLITFLTDKALFTLWNQPYRLSEGDKFTLGIPIDEKIYDYYEKGKDIQPLIDKMEANYQSFFALMQPFFDEKIQTDFEIKISTDKEKGNYTLEVEMEYIKPKVTRTIQLGNHLTLDDLHYAIINSIDFNDDHLYAFYIDKNKRNGYGRFYEYGEPPFAKDFKLVDLKLSVNKRFYYRFDFGASWDFIITVKAFEAREKPLNESKLIAQKGRNPEQYPSWEDEE